MNEMKTKLFSALLLSLVLVFSLFLAVACDSDPPGTTATTEGVTEAPIVRPTLDIPKDAVAVDALIASIDGATLENEDKIDLAYLGYWSLTDAERAKVTGYEALQSYRYELTKAYVVKEYKDTRIPHNEFLLGTYYGDGVYDEQYFKDVTDAYLDFVWCPYTADKNVMDLYQRYGIGVFMNLTFTGVPTDNRDEESFRAAIAGKTFDHEAIWLIDHMDEPSHAPMFISLWRNGKIISEEIFPNSAYLMNLLPSLHEEYIAAYADSIAPLCDIISFDRYVYSEYDAPGWLNNLSLNTSVCRKADADLYVIGQVGNWEEKGPLTMNQLKFQIYTSMAYGAKSFTWACWNDGWWKYGMVDSARNKTEQYYFVQETNRDVKALEPVFMRYTGASDVLLWDNCPAKKTYEDYEGNTDVSAMTQSTLTDLTIGDNSVMLIGHFEKNVGAGEAFLFMGMNNFRYHNNKEPYAYATFKTADPTSVVIAYVKGIPSLLLPDENGMYTVEVFGADAVFVTVSEAEKEEPTPPATPEESDGLLYLLNEEGTAYTVVGMTENASLTLVIPETFEGLPVTAIGERAFEATAITTVTLPDSITTIGGWTFASCQQLTEVALPSGITEIPDGAFFCCIKLGGIDLPDGLVTIGRFAFAGCDGLTTLVLPDTVTTLEYGAFTVCFNLKDVTLSESLVTIEDYAFYWCYPLAEVVIPDTVETIGAWAFSGTSITHMTLGKSVTFLGWGVFAGDPLTEIILPDTLTTITDGCFKDCRLLTSIVIPAGVTTVGNAIFENCASLTDVYCEAPEKPEGWIESWIDPEAIPATVHWGYAAE